jgi:hypothetical protein
MEKLTRGESVNNVPKMQQRPMRLTAAEILSEIKRAYRIDEKRLLRRDDQAAFKAWGYLLRRLGSTR